MSRYLLRDMMSRKSLIVHTLILCQVKRLLEKLIRPNDESQYKKVEDAISRALFDVEMSGGRKRSGASEFQKLMWLERARHLNGEIVLLVEGLLGESVAGADLMNNIKENPKVNNSSC